MRSKKIQITILALIFCFSFIVLNSYADNKGLQSYSISNAMNSMPSDVKAKIGSFKFYFGESAGSGAKVLGEIRTEKRSSSFKKSATESCNWAFYSALIDLKEQTQRLGGNAVANIKSNWKNNPTSSESTYMCDKGFWMSGVAFTGQAVKE